MSYDDRKRDAPSEDSTDLAPLVLQAFAPSELETSINERLIAQALAGLSSRSVHGQIDDLPDLHCSEDEPPIPADERERQAAEELRAALEDERDHPLLDLANALVSAYHPMRAAGELNASAVDEALRDQPRLISLPGRRWSYAVGVLAMAAGAILWITSQRVVPSSAPAVFDANQLVQSRSLSPIFAQTLEPATPTQRIDRIYAVRSRELRHNRFVGWRVR